MTQHSTTRRIGTRTRYVGLWAVAAVCYVSGLLAGYPLFAVAAFVLFGVAATATVRRADGVVFDERDRDIIEAASANTIQLLGVGSAIVFPSMVVLTALEYVRWPPWLGYVGFVVAGLFALWLAFLALERYRR